MNSTRFHSGRNFCMYSQALSKGDGREDSRQLLSDSSARGRKRSASGGRIQAPTRVKTERCNWWTHSSTARQSSNTCTGQPVTHTERHNSRLGTENGSPLYKRRNDDNLIHDKRNQRPSEGLTLQSNRDSTYRIAAGEPYGTGTSRLNTKNSRIAGAGAARTQ